jgi:hypothetical protein
MLLIVLIIVVPAQEFALCESGVELARSARELAEDSLKSAFLSVLEAERGGVDVSELVSCLRVAVEHYSEAERAFESGDYDGAVILAEWTVEAAKNISDNAVRLRGVAEVQGEIAFGYWLFQSFSTVCVVVVSGYFGWGRFRGYYVRRLMGLRPEVSVDES